MPAKDECPHDAGTYIHTIGNVELTKCAKCHEVLMRQLK